MVEHQPFLLILCLIRLQRLTLQHTIWRIAVGGLYPNLLEDVIVDLLSPRDGVTPAVLDLGSGSGIWCLSQMLPTVRLLADVVRAVEMARRFPQAEVVGFDLSQSKPSYGTIYHIVY